MGNRIDYWKEKGYTQEQINNHLKYEKGVRETRIKWENEIKEKRKQEIEYVKQALKSTEYRFRNVTTDGRGFWIVKPYLYGKKKTESYFIEWAEYTNLDFYIGK